ncbi:MAG TPA: hypothetical protein VIN56_10150 [Candidatus Dormibacteraeota bacterium]|jgi:hypothetical protein
MESGYETIDIALDPRSIRTFEEGGLLTRDRGLIIRTADGREYQLTIQDSTR